LSELKGNGMYKDEELKLMVSKQKLTILIPFFQFSRSTTTD